MPIVREFEYKRDEYGGFTGLCPAWFANATPTIGSGCAHDVLEHFKTQKNALSGECEAVGAIIALRLENAGLGDISASISSNLVAMFNDYLVGGLELPEKRASKPLAHRRIDLAIVEGVNKAWKMLEVIDAPDALPDMFEQLKAPGVQQNFIGWIRRGYRRALLRYSAIDRYIVGFDLFNAIAQKLDALVDSRLLWMHARVQVCVHLALEQVNINVFDEQSSKWVSADNIG